MLFFIIIGIVLESKKGDGIIFNKNLLFIPACFGILYMQVLSLHYVFIYNDKRELAQKIYPYNKENTEILIAKNLLYIGNEQKTAAYLLAYQHDFSLDSYKLEYIGDTYLLLGNPYKRKALNAYEDSFLWGSYAYGGSMIDRMSKLYTLKKELDGEKKAKQYVRAFTQEYRKILEQDDNKIQGDLYDNLVGTYLQ